MQLDFSNFNVPLRMDEHGTVRVGQTRVMLDLVIHSFKMGATPEEIICQYTTLDLADVYAVIAYYLKNKEAVEAYISEGEKKAELVKKKIQERFPTEGLSEKLLARKAQLTLQPA